MISCSFCENPFASKRRKRVVRRIMIKGLAILQISRIRVPISAEKDWVMLWNVREAGSIPTEMRNGLTVSRVPSNCCW